MKSTALKDLLDQYKITQKQFSDETGISETQISRWVTTETNLRLSTSKVIIQYFANKTLDNSKVV